MSDRQPDVSVVVPVYEDPAGVRRTLESLLDQTWPADGYEVVVVDNDSADRTPAVVASFAERTDVVSLAFERSVQSSYAARNEGVERASGDLLLFVDADVTVPETWIEEVVERFETTDVDYLGCAVEVYVPEGERTLVGEYEAAVGFPVEYYVRERAFAPTCCLAVRREVVDAVGRFRSDLVSGGDREFGRRVADAGFEQAVATDLVVRHPARTRLDDLRSKHVRIGRGQEQLARTGEAAAGSRPLWHPAGLLPPDPRTFAARCSADAGPARWLAYFGLAYLSKLFRLAGRLRERRRTTGELEPPHSQSA